MSASPDQLKALVTAEGPNAAANLARLIAAAEEIGGLTVTPLVEPSTAGATRSWTDAERGVVAAYREFLQREQDYLNGPESLTYGHRGVSKLAYGRSRLYANPADDDW